MRCIRQGSDQKRAFVDEMLGFGYQKQIKEDFNRVLKEKKRFLKSVKQGLLSVREADRVLTALNHNFLHLSFKLVQERLKVLKNLFEPLVDLRKSFLFKRGAKSFYSFSFGKSYPSGSRGLSVFG